MRKAFRSVPDVTQPSRQQADGLTPLAQLYLTTIELQRDQIAAQLESASTNALQSIAVLAAVVALLVAMLLIRETSPTQIGWWWWIPLTLFVVPTVAAGAPIMRRKDRSSRTAHTSLRCWRRSISHQPPPLKSGWRK